MSLKREIAELEQVEEMEEEEELTEERRQAEQRSIDERVVGLYRRINIIVEYIDGEEETEYAHGYREGAEALAEKLRGEIDQLMADKKETTEGESEETKEKETTKNRGLGLGRKIGDV